MNPAVVGTLGDKLHRWIPERALLILIIFFDSSQVRYHNFQSSFLLLFIPFVRYISHHARLHRSHHNSLDMDSYRIRNVFKFYTYYSLPSKQYNQITQLHIMIFNTKKLVKHNPNSQLPQFPYCIIHQIFFFLPR